MLHADLVPHRVGGDGEPCAEGIPGTRILEQPEGVSKYLRHRPRPVNGEDAHEHGHYSGDGERSDRLVESNDAENRHQGGPAASSYRIGDGKVGPGVAAGDEEKVGGVKNGGP